MTKFQAENIIRRVWISERNLSPAEQEMINKVELKNETALDTCLRIAGIEINWRDIPTVEGRRKAIMDKLIY